MAKKRHEEAANVAEVFEVRARLTEDGDEARLKTLDNLDEARSYADSVLASGHFAVVTVIHRDTQACVKMLPEPAEE